MFKSDTYNNLHEKTIPTLKRGEIAIFKCVHFTYDEYGTPIYPTYIVPNTDVVWDPVKEEYIDIAYITSPPVVGRPESLGEIVFSSSEKGVISLSGDRAADVAMYQYLKLSNFNGTNLNRDKSKMVIFKEVTENAKINETIASAKKQMEMLKFATEAPIDELVSYLRGQGVDPFGYPDDKIRTIALEIITGKSEPVIKPSVEQTPVDEFATKINELINTDIIYYDSKTQYYKFKDGDTNIAKVFKVVKDKPMTLVNEINKDPELKAKILSLIN